MHGYWCYRNGHSYWGIQLAYTVAIGRSLHHLDRTVKAKLLAWKF